MLVKLKRPDGRIEDKELPNDMFLEIGDFLSDGSEVLHIKYPEDIDDDMNALDLY